MPIVYNNELGVPDAVSEEEAKDTSKYSPLADQKVDMTSPDGRLYTVPGSSVEDAIAKGWTPKTISPQEEHDQGIQKEAEASYSPTKIAVRKFANEGLLGVPDIIRDSMETAHEKEVQSAQYKKFETEHNILSPALTGAGFATSLLTGAPLADLAGHAAERAVLEAGENLASRAAIDALPDAAKLGADAAVNTAKTSATRQVVASIAKNAAAAEAFSAPSQAANIAVGDPNQAAESLLWSLGTGGVLGAAGGLGKLALKAGSEALADKLSGLNIQGEATKAIDDQALIQAGVKPSKLEPHQKTAALSLLQEEGKYGNVVSDEWKQGIANDAGQKIGDHESFVDAHQQQLNDANIPDHSTLEDPSVIQDSKERALYDLDKADSTNRTIKSDPSGFQKFGINPSNLADSIEEKFEAQNPGVLNAPMNSTEKQTMQDYLDTMRTHGSEPISFAEAKELNNTLNSKTKWHASDTDLNSNVKQFVVNQLSQEKDYQMQKAFTAIGGADDKFADYRAQRDRYSAAKTLLDPKLQLPESVKGLAPGALNQHTSAISLLTGHPAIAATMLARPILGKIAQRAVLPYIIKGAKRVATEAPEAFGSVLAKAGNEAVDKHLSTIPEMILSGAKKAPLAAINPLHQFLGDEKTGLSSDQQYDRTVSRIVAAQVDPTNLANQIGHLAAVFGNHPELQHLLMQKNMDAVNYLGSQVPKNPNDKEPFSKNDWKPTAQQKSDFLKTLAVVEDPMVAIYHMANGTLTNKEVEALKTVYPTIYENMKSQVAIASASPGAHKAKTSVRIAASKFTGVPMANSLKPENMQRTQSSFSQPPQTQSPNGSAPAPKHTNTSLQATNSLQTSTQRLANR